jgi:hypothetical protein
VTEEKKTQKTSKWAGMEGTMSALGKWAWAFVVGGAILDLALGLKNMSDYYFNINLAGKNIASALVYLMYMTNALNAVWFAVFNFSFAIACAVLIGIYVIKPFGARCGAKDWEALIKDTLGSSLSKMWFLGILLACVSYGFGGFGVLVPVIALTFVGPGKGRVFGGKTAKV